MAAATARGIPVTNVPDTFLEEVADHALMLILATFRRLTPWTGSRAMAVGVKAGRYYRSFPPHGPDTRVDLLGHVARAVTVRARAFGLRLWPMIRISRS